MLSYPSIHAYMYMYSLLTLIPKDQHFANCLLDATTLIPIFVCVWVSLSFSLSLSLSLSFCVHGLIKMAESQQNCCTGSIFDKWKLLVEGTQDQISLSTKAIAQATPKHPFSHSTFDFYLKFFWSFWQWSSRLQWTRCHSQWRGTTCSSWENRAHTLGMT